MFSGAPTPDEYARSQLCVHLSLLMASRASPFVFLKSTTLPVVPSSGIQEAFPSCDRSKCFDRGTASDAYQESARNVCHTIRAWTRLHTLSGSSTTSGAS